MYMDKSDLKPREGDAIQGSASVSKKVLHVDDVQDIYEEVRLFLRDGSEADVRLRTDVKIKALHIGHRFGSNRYFSTKVNDGEIRFPFFEPRHGSEVEWKYEVAIVNRLLEVTGGEKGYTHLVVTDLDSVASVSLSTEERHELERLYRDVPKQLFFNTLPKDADSERNVSVIKVVVGDDK